MINCFIKTNQCIHRMLIRLIRERWGCKGIQQTLAIKIIKLMAIRIKKMRTSKLLHKQPTTAIQILLHLILPFEICQKIRKKNKRKRLKSNQSYKKIIISITDRRHQVNLCKTKNKYQKRLTRKNDKKMTTMIINISILVVMAI